MQWENREKTFQLAAGIGLRMKRLSGEEMLSWVEVNNQVKSERILSFFRAVLTKYHSLDVLKQREFFGPSSVV